MSKTKDTDYIFLSTNVRARETRLLSRERLEKMAEAADYNEAARIAADAGFPSLEGMDDAAREAALAARRQSVLNDIAGFCPEPELVTAFRLKYDVHNLKVAVKAAAAQTDGERLFSACGSVEPAVLSEAVRTESFGALPAWMAEALASALRTMQRTGSPQLTDFGLDKAYFAEMLAETGRLSGGFYLGYVRLCIDAANLRSAVRCVRAGLDAGVLRTALIGGGNVDADGILAAAADGTGLAAYFAGGELQTAAELGAAAIEGAPLAAFELECDNALNRHLEGAKMVSFGEAPAVGYLAAVDAEIVAVRMILQGRLSGIAPAVLKERLRDPYV